jgi:copper chaperone CopZ
MAEIKLNVNGMGCKGCVQPVTRALQSVAGVETAQVELGAGSAVVQFDALQTGPQELIAAVEQAGYRATASEL